MPFEIVGIRRTSKTFLDGIQGTSKGTKEAVMDKLKRLKIFSTITEANAGISVTEDKRSISFSGDTTKNVPKGYFKLRLPNLFGRAENLKVSLSTSRDMSLKFMKPVVCGSLNILNLCMTKDVKRSPDAEYLHTRINIEVERKNERISVGHEKIGYLSQIFLEVQKSLSPFNIKAKAGVSDVKGSKGLVKTQINMFLNKNFAKNLFTSFSLSIGAILGNPHVTERYYLGENIRGYKDKSISPKSSGMKVGGKSFIEATQKLGVYTWNANAFIFGSLGYVSEGSDVVNTFKSAARLGLIEIMNALERLLGRG